MKTFVIAYFLIVCVSLLLSAIFITTQPIARPPARPKSSVGVDTYYGKWRHVALPPEISRHANAIDVDELQQKESHDSKQLEETEQSSSFVLMTPEQKKELLLEKNKKVREQSHFVQDRGSQFSSSTSPSSFALDFEVSNLQQLLDISAKARMKLKMKQVLPNEMLLMDSSNNNSSSSPLSNLHCSARLITRSSSSSSSSSSSQTTSEATFPSALEVSCHDLDKMFTHAGSFFKNEQILKQQKQNELALLLEVNNSKLHNNTNSNINRKAKPIKRKPTDEDFDPAIPSFRFLNYDESTIYWPMARVSTVLYTSSSNDDQVLRHFEGSNTGCIESNSALTVQQQQNENDDDHILNNQNNNGVPVNTLSRLSVLVPLERSSSSAKTSTSSIQDLLLSSSSKNNQVILSIRIRMLPLGNRNPVSRQLVRWLKYAQTSDDATSDDKSKNEADDLYDFEREQQQVESINNDTNVMFELRATEKRLTRVGGGFRARLRRNDSRLAMTEIEKKKYHRQIRHLPIYTNWSIEVFRRVPRPNVECIAVFSRLLDFPEMFHPNTVSAAKNLAQTADHEEEVEAAKQQTTDNNNNNNNNKKPEKIQLVDDSDPFDDDDDEEDEKTLGKLSDEEMKLKRKRERIRTLLAQKEHKAAVPSQEQIANAKMHLVAAHQLRGILDSHFSLPEFSKLSPVISIPSAPAPALMESDSDIVASRKRPPTGLLVLYISQERTREQVVDVEIKQADYHFVAPLKLEKKLLNVTFKGEYERLPIPRPPVTNWTWFDTNDVALVPPPQVSQHKKLDPRLAAQVNSPEAIHEQQMLDSRGTLPRLTFLYRDSSNNTQLPGFSILLEQNRPIDDLLVWIFDGKNDTLFLDEESYVPFTVPSHTHDSIDSPLFGWRLALDSQRLMALDAMYISFAFNYRRTISKTDSGDDNNDGDFNNDVSSPPSTSDYLSAISLFHPGQEAAKHLLSWVDVHRWVPLAETINIKNLNARQTTTDGIINSEEPQGLPHFASFVEYQRNFLAAPLNNNNNKLNSGIRRTKPVASSISLEQDSKTGGLWRLFARRDFTSEGTDLFSLPWSAIIRHSQAPNWIVELVTSREFEERVLRKHEQVLLANDHVDLTNNNVSSTDDSNNNNNNNEDDPNSSSSASIKRIREMLNRRRQTAFDNVRAWCLLTLMHWAQVEPELSTVSPLKWGSETIATRFHCHYRMFNERVKTDAARKLRNFVVSRHKNKGLSRQEERNHLPSSSWCPLSEIIAQRSAFLQDAANFFLEIHPGLPRKFSGGEVGAADWFSSAFTIIEARSLLVTLNMNDNQDPTTAATSEWIYIPLLDYATPGISATEEFEMKNNNNHNNKKVDESEKANIDLVFARGTVATSHFALRVVTSKPISKGTPLIFGGWSGRGFRTAIDGLVLFGFLNANMGFAETATPLLPFGPVLHHNDKQDGEMLKEARNSILDECKARCSRISEGRTISMTHDHGYAGLLKERSESLNGASSSSMLTSEEQEVKNNQENSKKSCSTCCNIQWLDAKLRRRWKQVAANDLLWSVPREALKKLMWAVSKFPRDTDVASSSENNSNNTDDVVSLVPEPEPPLWRASKQYLVSSTRKVLETQIAEIAAEMEQQKVERIPALKSMPKILSGLNVRELVAAVFGDEDSTSNIADDDHHSSSSRSLKVDSPIESYIDDSDDTIYFDDEAKWFGCCKKNGGIDVEEQEISQEDKK